MLHKQRNLNGVVGLIGHSFGHLAEFQLRDQGLLNGLFATNAAAFVDRSKAT
jgi:hypothetical protein